MKKHFFIVVIVSSLFSSSAFAQPKWMQKVPHSKRFCYIAVQGQSGEDLFKKAIKQLPDCSDKLLSGVVTNYGGKQIEIGGNTFNYKIVHAENYGSYTYKLYKFRSADKPMIEKTFLNPIPITLPLSIVVPGLGQLYKRQTGRGFLFLFSFLATAVTGTYFEIQRQKDFDAYKVASSFSEKESLIDKIRTSYRIRNVTIGAAASIYLLNLIDVVAFKSKIYALNRNKSLHWNLAYHPEAQTPVFGVRLPISSLNSRK